MVLRFQELRGAAGDVKELEYISALHQTDVHQVRKDASIFADDVRLFLMSRYGIKVTEQEVRETIFGGMAGGSSAEECLDLMEVVAILLMPTLLKAAEVLYGEELGEEIIQPPTDLLEYVLKMILHDVTGDSTYKKLNTELLRSILVAYGECDLASDETLLQEMVEAASSMDTLNVHAFAEGLTSDIRLFDVRTEVLLTTNLDAVFLNHVWDSKEQLSASGEQEEEESAFFKTATAREKLAIGKPLVRVNTIPAIDLTADTYRSKALMVIMWATFLITIFAYWVDDMRGQAGECEGYEYDYNSPWGQNIEAMTCEAGSSIFVWVFVFGFMALVGLLSSLVGSVGNAVDCKKAWRPVMGALFMFLFVVFPYSGYKRQKASDHLLTNVSLILGIISAMLHLHHAYILLIQKKKTRLLRSIKKWVPLNTVFAESKIKRCAARKLARMTKNALEIVRVKDVDHVISTHYGQALQSYNKHGKEYVDAGGLRWAWKRIIGRKSFADDGIWIPARFVASNIAQYIVSIYIFLYGIYLTRLVWDNYDSEDAQERLGDYVKFAFDTTVSNDTVDELTANVTSIIRNYVLFQSVSTSFGCSNFSSTAEEVLDTYCSEINGTLTCDQNSTANYLCPLISSPSLSAAEQAALLQGAGLDEALLREVTREALEQAAEQSVDSLYPSEKYMVVIPVIFGTLVAFLVSVYLSVIYIPSVTTTILKLRCGLIPTLQDKNFFRYRVAPDQVSVLTGSLFWGSFVSSVVVGGFIAAIIFFFLWQATVYFAQRFVALLIGIIVIILVRLSVLLTCRCTMYRSFYREKPGSANLSILGLEWANFLLSAGFVLVRMVKLLVVAGASIGRIDTPFLAPGVGRVGPIELDNYPIVHTKDILAHEAHRHPYLEQLGLMYLMKLRYAEHFGKRAGSCWRLIFVYALMPWLHKYRVQARPDRCEKSRALSEAETQQYPSLQFVSLNNVNSSIAAAQQESEYLTIDDDDDDEPDRSQKELPRAAEMKQRHVTFLMNSSEKLQEEAVESKRRVEELESEVRRLKAELAAAQYLNDNSINV